MANKSVLIIPPFNPYPLISGGHQAIFNGISILKDIANVYVIVSVTQSQYNRGEYKRLRNELPFAYIIPFILPNSKHNLKWYCNVLCNKVRKYIPRIPRLKCYETAKTNSTFVFDTIGEPWPEMIELMRSSIKTFNIDIVQTEMSYEMGLVKYMPDNVRKIFVHHELCFVRNQLALSQYNFATIVDKLAIEKDKQTEVNLLNMYDDVVTLSAIDSKKLKEAGVTTPITTSLAVVRNMDNKNEVSCHTKVLTFIGPSFHSPNYEGVLWFLNNCWGRLYTKDSDYSLNIIGQWSDDAKCVVEQFDNVHCLGYVDNLEDAIIGTTMIVPLTIGSGIRMKILEAAKLKVPVVTTPVGVEGLPLVDGVHLFVTDNPDLFVEDIIKLEDSQIRDRFVANTSDVINRYYSLESMLESRRSLYL